MMYIESHVLILLFIIIVIYFCRKPVTHKGKKAILKKEPKLVENAKETLCLKGKRTSQIVTDVMKDLVNKYVITLIDITLIFLTIFWKPMEFLNLQMNYVYYLPV